MSFTWLWKNSCVIYEWWHVKTLGGFLGTLLTIALLSAFYEFSRAWINTWKSKNRPSLLTPTSSTRNTAFKVKSALLYAFQVGFSFMLMLVFMTYNGWYMIAVVVGAGVGHFLWGSADADARGLVCH